MSARRLIIGHTAVGYRLPCYAVPEGDEVPQRLQNIQEASCDKRAEHPTRMYRWECTTGPLGPLENPSRTELVGVEYTGGRFHNLECVVVHNHCNSRAGLRQPASTKLQAMCPSSSIPLSLKIREVWNVTRLLTAGMKAWLVKRDYGLSFGSLDVSICAPN